MSSVFEKSVAPVPVAGYAGLELQDFSPVPSAPHPEPPACFHCGEPCRDDTLVRSEKHFCCQGCLAVHEILAASGLERFYELAASPGVKTARKAQPEKWAYLDTAPAQEQLLDFTDGQQSHVTLQIPAIHCVACVWLLENLFRLHSGIGESRVNFARRELAVRFAPAKISLAGLAALLSSLGYEPQFTFGQKGNQGTSAERRRRWLQVGVAGFAFGNIMLFSIPLYLGLDSFSGPAFRALFGYVSLALAIPVLLYSASDYWKGALRATRYRMLTLDVPIAIGLAALYLQSALEIVSGRGEGYLDSLAGLVFLLLCGRAFQQTTFNRLAFDRDYKSFFPLSALRKTAAGEKTVTLSDIKPGDRLVIRHGELIPADSRLIDGEGLIDYSFVTGESEAVARKAGDHLYAGGRQEGAAIEVETVRPVSQSYLASLWDHQAFRKARQDDRETMTNKYSRRFTRLVIAIAFGAALFWAMWGAPARGFKAFTSVLIVACPCALALAAPFALGTVQRLLARRNIFLKNTTVLERLAAVSAITFDKTGTLTSTESPEVIFCAADPQQPLTSEEQGMVTLLAGQSTHPHARSIHQTLPLDRSSLPPISGFRNVAGEGIEGEVQRQRIQLGSMTWLRRNGVETESASQNGSSSSVAINGQFRGTFFFKNSLRPETREMLRNLSRQYELALLSGDNNRERERFRELLGNDARLHFNQSPVEKLEFIRELQGRNRTVMMVGDGLNDAGALQQSDVGVAVVERLGTFSPASDIILEAARVTDLHKLLSVARRAKRVVHLSFILSAVYNAVGISIAAAGILSPLICAVLMPLSSASVVLFACGAATWSVRKAGWTGKELAPCT